MQETNQTSPPNVQPEQPKNDQAEERKEAEKEAYDELNCYKVINQNICKLQPDGKLEKVYTIQGDILYPKLAQASATQVYLVGGSSDVKFNNTLNTLYLLDFSVTPLRLVEKAKMATSRASHGVCMSNDKKKIYVCGGNSAPAKILNKCEYYDIEANTWNPLPDLAAPKFASGVCEFVDSEGKISLYCFGGVTNKKNESGGVASEVNDEIEKVCLSQNISPNFEILSAKMLNSGCDFTCKQVSDSTIMIKGGWNRVALAEVSYFDVASETFKK